MAESIINFSIGPSDNAIVLYISYQGSVIVKMTNGNQTLGNARLTVNIYSKRHIYFIFVLRKHSSSC
jgi:hypothetical protein